MRQIKMDEGETALWKETGTRGSAFRRGMHYRASELVRERGGVVEIVDDNDAMVDNTLAAERQQQTDQPQQGEPCPTSTTPVCAQR
jgi:hypothetical protein